MSQIQDQSKQAEKIASSHFVLIKSLLKDLDRSIRGKREIMYSDIINLIIREDYRGTEFNEIILWCNSKIKQGKYNVLLE